MEKIRMFKHNGNTYRIWTKGSYTFLERFEPLTIGNTTIMAPVPTSKKERDQILRIA